jgi:hypothetical protein
MNIFNSSKLLTRLTKTTALLLVASGFASSALQAQENSGSLSAPTDDQLLAIGQRTMSGLDTDPATAQPLLASWDPRGFACLGIAQNIWYNRANVLANPNVFIFVEDWPAVASQLSDAGVAIPNWALGSENCPWQTADQMNADPNLPALLATLSTDPAITQQARCIYNRLIEAMDPNSPTSILANLPPGEAELIQNNFNAVAAVVDANNKPLGTFALIDYDNFKGEGTAPKERYNTQGWGLQEVLAQMDPSEMQAVGALQAFVTSAQHCLKARVKNAMIEYDRNNTPVDNPNSGLTNQREMYKQSWKAMWTAHLDGYLSWPVLTMLNLKPSDTMNSTSVQDWSLHKIWKILISIPAWLHSDGRL